MDYLMLFGGLLLLVGAGELLVRGAVGIALKFHISTLVIGMTIVSFGTSAPELLVSVKAALEGHPDISIGNVVGSNISNLGLVLGVTALIFPIVVDRSSLRIDWPVMMGATVLFALFILNGKLELWEGLLFVTLLTVFSIWLIRTSRKSAKARSDDDTPKVKPNLLRDFVFILVGCVGLTFGADLLLDGAVTIARSWGVSERVIAVTIVAFGTSVPELVTSGVAALRKQTDISIGNLIGSNLFNLLGILGVTAIVKEIPISADVLSFDVYWLLAISLALFPIMVIGRKVTRVKGALLLAAYCTYIYMVL